MCTAIFAVTPSTARFTPLSKRGAVAAYMPLWGLVDLDEVAAGRDERAALGVDDRDEVGERRVPVRVAAVEPQRDEQRVGAGHGRLEPLRRQRARELPLLDDAEPLGRRDRLGHLERRVPVPEGPPELPGRLERANAGKPGVET